MSEELPPRDDRGLSISTWAFPDSPPPEAELALHRTLSERYQACLHSIAQAQAPHQEALAEVLQFKADLARSYYQLGITYQLIGNADKSYENFAQVDCLLSELEAESPNQNLPWV